MANRSPKSRLKKKIEKSKASVKTTRSGRAKPIPISIEQAGSRARSKADALAHSIASPSAPIITTPDPQIKSPAEIALENEARNISEWAPPFVARRGDGYFNDYPPSAPKFLLSDPPKKWYQRLANWFRKKKRYIETRW